MKRLKGNDTKSVIIKILISVLSGFAASLILVLLFSLLISKNDISSDIVKYFWFPITISGAALSGLISGRIIRIKGILSGVITSLVFSVTVLGVLLFINSFSLSIVAVFIIPVCLITGTICSIISANFR